MEGKTKTLNNHLLVKLDPENDHIKTKNGIRIEVDTTYEPERHVVRLGTVEAVCDGLKFEGGIEEIELGKSKIRRRKYHMDWETEMEARPGDRVVMYFMAVQNCLRPEYGKYIRENGETSIFITYQNIYAVIRDGNIIPVNGYILVEPVEDPYWERLVEKYIKVNIEIPDMRKPSLKDVCYGRVRHIGTANIRYADRGKSDEGYDVAVGDTVVMKRISDIPMEYEYHTKLENKMYRIQRHDILAKL